MKKECLVRFVEFYKLKEKLSSVKIYLDEGKEIEQLKIFIDSYKNSIKFCNDDYQGMMFVKATIYNEDKDIEFEMDGEYYEKIQKEEKTF